MPKTCQETLHFQVLPSKQVGVLNDVLHLCAILACWFNNLQTPYQLLLIATLLVFWRRNRKRCEATPVFLSYTENTGWEVSLDGSNYLHAMILDTTVMTSVVIFLHYKMDNRASRALVIAKDSLSVNDFRRLIIRLKLSARGRGR